MGIAAAFAGAAAGPMLDHGVDAVLAPAGLRAFGGLHTVAVRLDHFLGLLHVFAEGINKAHPARLGADVDLRAEGGGDAEGTVFSGSVFRKLTDNFGIKASRKADAFRPLAHVAAGVLELRIHAAAGTVAGVGGDVDRDAVGQGFRALLQGVAPLGGRFGVLHAGEQNVADVFVFEEALLLVGKGMSRRTGFRERLTVKCAAERAKGHGRYGLMRGEEHQTGDFFEAQALSKVHGALPIGETPVFVRQELAGFGQILKVQAVLFDELYTGIFGPREGFAVFLRQTADAVLHGLVCFQRGSLTFLVIYGRVLYVKHLIFKKSIAYHRKAVKKGTK